MNLVPFVDIETTGLDHHKDWILEVAMFAVNPLGEIMERYDTVIAYGSMTEQLREKADPFVQDMHDKNGLWEEVRAAPYPSLPDVEMTLRDLYKKWFGHKMLPMYGNSLRLDREFLDLYMPEFHQCFHYRTVDISTIKELSVRYAPDVASEWNEIANREEKPHRAAYDLEASVAELNFYLSSMRNQFWRT